MRPSNGPEVQGIASVLEALGAHQKKKNPHSNPSNGLVLRVAV